MKQFMLVLLMCAAISTQAQFTDGDNAGATIRAGVGYVHDFPGLHGTAVYAQYSFPLNEWLQGGAGVKHVQSSGYPRTQSVQEYTKANTIDAELLFVPLHTETASLRFGLSYTFSFYSIRRSYPVYSTHDGGATDITWPVVDSKGSVRGAGLVAEYEYNFSSQFSGGVKVAFSKAYDGIIVGGPFVGIRF